MKGNAGIIGLFMIFAFLGGDFSHCGELSLETSTYLPVKASAESVTSKFLLKFDLTAIPSNAIIDLAFLNITADLDSEIMTPLNLIVYPVIESWESSTTPVVKQSIAVDDSLSYVGVLGGKTGQDVEFIVTDLIQAWASDEMANNGIVIMPLEKPESSLDVYSAKPGIIAELKVLYSVSPEAD